MAEKYICPNCGEEVYVIHRCSGCGRKGCWFCHFDNHCEKCGSSKEYCLDCLVSDYGTKYCKHHYQKLHKSADGARCPKCGSKRTTLAADIAPVWRCLECFHTFYSSYSGD